MTLVAQSQVRCFENRRLLEQSRRLIASSRRILNPAWEISGSSDDLRQTVRDHLVSGALFLIPHKVWTSYGTGHTCRVCKTIISSNEIEHEVFGLTPVWVHATCYSIWRQESDALIGANRSGPATDVRKNGMNTDELLGELQSSRTDLARFVDLVIRDRRPYLVIASQAVRAWEAREPQTWAKVVRWLEARAVTVLTV